MVVVRSLGFPLSSELPFDPRSLMNDYRLVTNRLLRVALNENLTARGSLTPFAQQLAREYHLNWHHVETAPHLAVSLVKGGIAVAFERVKTAVLRSSERPSFAPTIKPFISISRPENSDFP